MFFSECKCFAVGMRTVFTPSKRQAATRLEDTATTAPNVPYITARLASPRIRFISSGVGAFCLGIERLPNPGFLLLRFISCAIVRLIPLRTPRAVTPQPATKTPRPAKRETRSGSMCCGNGLKYLYSTSFYYVSTFCIAANQSAECPLAAHTAFF